MKRKHYSDFAWERAKQDFVSGETTLAQVAAKHGIKFKAVETRARRDDWKRQKNENLQRVKVIAGQAIEARSQELGERAAEFLGETCDQLKWLLEDFKAKRGKAGTLEEFERYVNTFASLVRTGRSLYGLDQDVAQPMINIGICGQLSLVEPVIEVEHPTLPAA